MFWKHAILLCLIVIVIFHILFITDRLEIDRSIDTDWLKLKEISKNLTVKFKKTQRDTCTFIHFDTEEPSVKQRFGKPSPLKCKVDPKKSKLWIMTDDGVIDFVNESGNKHLNYSLLDCTVTDKNSNHNKTGYVLHYGKEFPYKVQGDFVIVTCSGNSSAEYKNRRELFLNPRGNRRGLFQKESDEKFSVLQLFLDGMSILSFMKHLKKTRKVLNNLNFINFRSLNKVGLNTFPNLIPILSGKRPYTAQQGMESEIKKPRNVDNIPLVFQNFSKNGFATIFIEDSPSLGLFHFNKRLHKQPTDFYYYTYWKDLLKTKKKSRGCLGQNKTFEVAWNNIWKYSPATFY